MEALGITLLVALAMYCLYTDHRRTPTPEDFQTEDEL